ncbi:MAG TPA: lysophospholipid acyltransferase family protein [Gemmatimonadaceae bacterium]|jgi:KDO2-lipid IV(A) lauroyltransferase|nr:lysophospholipid acyltransferase family protein [Gemmatimonadaceae bacterium]
MASLSHRGEYWALRGAIGLLESLPRSWAVRLGAAIGGLGYAPLGIRRGVVEQQIAMAFPEMSPREVRETARGAYRHLGRNAAEVALIPRIGRQGVLDLFTETEGMELMDAALAAGRGIVVVTGHLGNAELAGSYIAARGFPLDALARRQANPLFDRYITAMRERIGMRVIIDSEGVRGSMRSLKAGRMVAFLADQGVRGMASTFVPFFGRPAKTPRGPAVFALRLDAPVLVASSMRLPSGRFRMTVEAIPVDHTGDRERDIDVVVARYTAALERHIRRAPEQYFWHHRRWRRQPPAGTESAIMEAGAAALR